MEYSLLLPVGVSSVAVTVLCFLSSLPCSSRVGADVVRLVEEYGTRLPAVVLGLLQTVTVTWGYGLNRSAFYPIICTIVKRLGSTVSSFCLTLCNLSVSLDSIVPFYEILPE